MIVYLTGAFEYMDRNVGFGEASYHIYHSLKELGIDVRIKRQGDDTPYQADIEICFDQPGSYKFMCPTSYKIGYTPWESSEFIPSWYSKLQAVDEIWVTSNWTKNIFEQKLPHKKIFVYQHGITHNWAPVKHEYDSKKPFTFLFIGEPYWRKNGQAVAESFIKLFGNDPDYRLVLKSTNMSTIKVSDPKGHMTGSPEALYNNIISISRLLDDAEMLSLFKQADVLLYPTWGEGFGFIPLQAIAAGLPVISTVDWCDYREHVTIPIESEWTLSPWPAIHPGYMMKPNMDQVEKAMKAAKENYSSWSEFTYNHSALVHEEYDWKKVSKPAALRLKYIFNTRIRRKKVLH